MHILDLPAVKALDQPHMQLSSKAPCLFLGGWKLALYLPSEEIGVQQLKFHQSQMCPGLSELSNG